MELEITYEKEDWLTFQKFLEKEIQKNIKTPWKTFFLNILLWAVVGAVSMSVFQQIGEIHWPTAGYVTALFIILSVLFTRYINKIKHAFAPSDPVEAIKFRMDQMELTATTRESDLSMP